MGDQKRRSLSKAEKFKENPDRFIDLEDLVVGAARQKGPNGENGIGYMINPHVSPTLLKASAFDIQDQVAQYIHRMNVAMAAKAAKDGLILPGGNGGVSRV